MKTSPNEIKQAIEYAQLLREQGKDQHHLAKVLLDYHERIGQLLKVFHATQHYLHSGLAEHEHTVLLKILDEIHRSDAQREGQVHTDLGLD